MYSSCLFYRVYIDTMHLKVLKINFLPVLAKLADIELLTAGESLSKSRSIDATKFNGSSKFKSSKALPKERTKESISKIFKSSKILSFWITYPQLTQLFLLNRKSLICRLYVRYWSTCFACVASYQQVLVMDYYLLPKFVAAAEINSEINIQLIILWIRIHYRFLLRNNLLFDSHY